MSSFHDQIFSEIDAARKRIAEIGDRHGRNAPRAPRVPGDSVRLAQEEAAAAEIAALAAEEERLAGQARDWAQPHAEARAEHGAIPGEAREVHAAPEPVDSRWNAMAVVKGLAKLRAEERSAAEELVRKANEVRDLERPEAEDHETDEQEEQPAAPVRGMWNPSLGAAQVWYFTSEGTRCGPVTFRELRAMAASRVLDPRLDMVWKEGMEGWKQAGLLDGLFERRTMPAGMPDTQRRKKVGIVTALPTDLTAALATTHMHWPGVGRLPLWLGLLLFPVLWRLLLSWAEPTLAATSGGTSISRLLPFAGILPFALLIYLVLMRLVNVGMSRWWALMLAIPVLNLWVGFRCLVCPAGYAYHRKLDRSGIAVAVGVVVIVPALLYMKLKRPDFRSPAQLQVTSHGLIDGYGKTAAGDFDGSRVPIVVRRQAQPIAGKLDVGTHSDRSL